MIIRVPGLYLRRGVHCIFNHVTAIHTSNWNVAKGSNETNRSEKAQSSDSEKAEDISSDSIRDLINFPRPKRSEKSPPVLLGFIPKYWFDFFYKKTGVTGGYMLFCSVTVALLSKEIVVINTETNIAISFVLTLYGVHKSLEKKIKGIMENQGNKTQEIFDHEQNLAKQVVRDEINMYEELSWQYLGITSFLPEIKRENVYLQMEAAYREYLQKAYLETKLLLDYHVERSMILNSIEKKNLFSWILNSVEKSITPEVKKAVLTSAIEDLKTLQIKIINP